MKLGSLNLILALDNDNAGHKAAQKIKDQYSSSFNIHEFFSSNTNDVAEMSSENIKKELIPILKKLSRGNYEF